MTTLRFVLPLFVLALCFSSSSCSKTQTAMMENAPAYQPTPTGSTVKMPQVVSPKLVDVHAAVHRVFKDAAIVDTAANPSFFVGDFNGDASEDLAVVLKPATGRVAELNEEYSPWLLRDLFSLDQATKPTVRIQQQDVLLAIIHGYGDNEWRDSQATQTFVLKNAIGTNMVVRTGKDLAHEHSGKRLPLPQGDLIAQNLRGGNGYLYYASSSYQWYDPKTFKPHTESGMVHARAPRVRN